MSYSDNLITDELCLIVINDGDGDQCGSSYHARCETFSRAMKSGRSGYDEALYLVRMASSTARETGCFSGVRSSDVRQAEKETAQIVWEYYRQHLTEG